jgi:hypothetical protein
VLADIAYHQGNAGEARALVERALSILRTVVGPAHEAIGAPRPSLSAPCASPRRRHPASSRPRRRGWRKRNGRWPRIAPVALALAKQARAALAALPFPSDELPGLDHWLATVR